MLIKQLIGQRRTIRFHLVVYAVGILLPLLALVAFLAKRYADAERATIEAEQLDVVNNLAFVIDREIEGLKGVLESMAASPELQAGNMEAARAHLQSAATLRNLSSLAIVDRTGQVLLSTAARPDEPLPKRDDPNELATVFQGHAVVSDLTYGKVTRRPIVVISVPVFDKANVRYALSAGIGLDRLSSLFADIGLRPNWLAVIIDHEGHLLARSTSGERYVGASARAEVIAAAISQTRGIVRGLTREGVPVSNSFRRSSVSGWTAIIGVPKTVLDAPLRRALFLLALASVAALSFALIAAGWFGRRISRPIQHLKVAALEVLDGRPPGMPEHSIDELEDIDRVFLYTATINAERKALQEKLQQAIQIAALGIFDCDHTTETVTASDVLRDILGLDHNSVLPTSCLRDVIAPEDRDEVEEKVRLAHAPNSGGRLRCECRIVHPSRGLRWISVQSQTWFEDASGSGRPLRSVGAVRDVTERKLVEQELQLLSRELAHRAKNQLTIVRALADQTAASAQTNGQFRKAFGERLQGLAASTDLLADQKWLSASLSEIIRRQLAPFLARDDMRLRLMGPAVSVTADVTRALGMALHELATNSVKYGALSTSNGILTVFWSLEPTDCGASELHLTWRERGGPTVAVPERKGFGHVIMERLVAQSLHGSVDLDFAPEGLTWRLRAPAERIVVSGLDAAVQANNSMTDVEGIPMPSTSTSELPPGP